jgi:hypothetical protein
VVQSEVIGEWSASSSAEPVFPGDVRPIEVAVIDALTRGDPAQQGCLSVRPGQHVSVVVAHLIASMPIQR